MQLPERLFINRAFGGSIEVSKLAKSIDLIQLSECLSDRDELIYLEAIDRDAPTTAPSFEFDILVLACLYHQMTITALDPRPTRERILQRLLLGVAWLPGWPSMSHYIPIKALSYR